MSNPFSLDFGSRPNLYIPRTLETNKIISEFTSQKPSTHIYLLLGARGCGKTVLMTSVSHKLRDDDRWVHYDISPEDDILEQLAGYLYRDSKNLLEKYKIELSVGSISVATSKNDKYSNIQADVDAMLTAMSRHNKRILISIDEVSNTKAMKTFATYFQHCLREEYPVFCIMTGLYKNIRALQNDKSHTFLKRVPRIQLSALNMERIAQKYMDIFNVAHEEALVLSGHTQGYSYAFQILGYLLFDKGVSTPDKDIMFEYRMLLNESSYEKIWEELSEMERKVAMSAADAQDNISVKQLREKLNMDSNNFSTYKDTLEKCGVFSDKTSYGYVEFALPYIKEFIVNKTYKADKKADTLN